jgi:hypothetical protein
MSKDILMFMHKIDPKKPVYLSENKIRSGLDFTDCLLEYGVFFRWIYFKNRPRTNFYLIRSILAVSVLGVIYYSIFSSLRLVLMGLDLDPILFLVFAISVSYWQMTNVYLKKKVSCTDIHNQILAAYGAHNLKTAKLLKNTLALHLLAEDLWAHKSYTYFFATALEAAVDYKLKESDASEKDIKAKYEKIESGQLEICETRSLLLSYKTYLLDIEEEELQKVA